MLIPKASPKSSTGEDLSKARLICLLNETGKIFERILVQRFEAHMNSSPCSRLSERQYSFLEGRSTLDALQAALATIERSTFARGFAFGVSLDIKNAFNSLPWLTIRWALWKMRFPLYLRRMVDGYLSARFVEYPTCDGIQTREVTRGVPQSSVLGPLLWSIYNYVLKLGRKYVPDCVIL